MSSISRQIGTSEANYSQQSKTKLVFPTGRDKFGNELMVNYTLIIRKENIFEQFLEIFVEIKESSLFQCICILFRVHVNEV